MAAHALDLLKGCAVSPAEPLAVQRLVEAYLHYKDLPSLDQIQQSTRFHAVTLTLLTAGQLLLPSFTQRFYYLFAAGAVWSAIQLLRAWSHKHDRTRLLSLIASSARLGPKHVCILGLPQEAQWAGGYDPHHQQQHVQASPYKPALAASVVSSSQRLVSGAPSTPSVVASPAAAMDVSRALLSASSIARREISSPLVAMGAVGSPANVTSLALQKIRSAAVAVAAGAGVGQGSAATPTPLSPEAAFIASLSATKAKKDEQQAAAAAAAAAQSGISAPMQQEQQQQQFGIYSPGASRGPLLGETLMLSGSPFRATMAGGGISLGSPVAASARETAVPPVLISPVLPYLSASRADRDAKTRALLAGSLGRAAGAGGAESDVSGVASHATSAITRHTGLTSADLDRLAGAVRSQVARHFNCTLLPALTRNTDELVERNAKLPRAWLERKQRRAHLPFLPVRGAASAAGVTLDDVIAEEADGHDTRYLVHRHSGSVGYSVSAGTITSSGAGAAPSASSSLFGAFSSSAASGVHLWSERAELESYLCPRRYMAAAAGAAAAGAAAAGESSSSSAVSEVDPVVYGASRLAALASDTYGMSGYAGDHRADGAALTSLGAAGSAYLAALHTSTVEEQEGMGSSNDSGSSSLSSAAAPGLGMLPPLPSDAELLLNYFLAMTDAALAEAANSAAAGGGSVGAPLAIRRHAHGRPFKQSDGLFSKAVLRYGPADKSGSVLLSTYVSGALQPAGTAALAAGIAADASSGRDDEDMEAAPNSVQLVISQEAPKLVCSVSMAAEGGTTRAADGASSPSGRRVTLDPGNDLTSRVALPRALGMTLHLLLMRDEGVVGGVPARAVLTRLLGGDAWGGPQDRGGAGSGGPYGILQLDEF